MIEEHRHAPEEGHWNIPLPYRRVPLLLNARLNHYTKNNLVQEIKKAAWAVARSMNIPPMKAAMVGLIYYPGQNKGPDADNLAATLKPALDGIVAAKVLPEDKPAHVLRTWQEVVLRRDDPEHRPDSRLFLHVINLSALYVPDRKPGDPVVTLPTGAP